MNRSTWFSLFGFINRVDFNKTKFVTTWNNIHGLDFRIFDIISEESNIISDR